LAKTIRTYVDTGHIRYFKQEITIYTIYAHIRCKYTVLANPSNMPLCTHGSVHCWVQTDTGSSHSVCHYAYTALCPVRKKVRALHTPCMSHASRTRTRTHTHTLTHTAMRSLHPVCHMPLCAHALSHTHTHTHTHSHTAMRSLHPVCHMPLCAHTHTHSYEVLTPCMSHAICAHTHKHTHSHTQL